MCMCMCFKSFKLSGSDRKKVSLIVKKAREGRKVTRALVTRALVSCFSFKIKGQKLYKYRGCGYY